ncbi:FtsK/SpoIIIE family DNA translocase [Sulfoacidibacillus thermotolerans]|uniref:FtsK domain-containing protein n=1 Tax=Sulfoacidibacillus thermotolerans TaxID=1765684 RepID=A0A2U3DAC7_SULT2|nr:DNA translocase FtsK [Sulfoacidibacillus thermotolerans]PWI58234.1 hypothetical protein BM613_04720 [Sulfoacidibacillus thermotolerans]
MAKLDHAKRVLKYEVLGLLAFVVGIVTLGDLGAVGQGLDDLCVMLAGNWHFLIPLYIMWVASIVMVRRNRFRFTPFQVGIAIWLLVILVWSELDLYSQGVIEYGTDHPDLLHLTQVGITSLSQSLRVLVVDRSTVLPPANAGGGMVGYALFAGLQYLFAVTGTLLVLVVASIIAVVLMTRKSIIGTIEKGSRFFETRFERGFGVFMKLMANVLQGGSKRTQKRVQTEREVQKESFSTGQASSTRKNARQRMTSKDALQSHEEINQEPEFIQDKSGHLAETKTSFPFPDFGVPYQQEPGYEDFMAEVGELEIHEMPTISDEHEVTEPHVTLDEAHSRMTVQLPRSKVNSLKPDPFVQQVAGVEQESHFTSDVSQENGGTQDHLSSESRPYLLPDVRLLDRTLTKRGESQSSQRDLQNNAKKLAETFESFGVHVTVLGYSRGPTVTRYEIQPAAGIKVSRILNLTNDLALALAARDIRIEAPIPGKSAVGIEVPNKEIAVVSFREVIESEEFMKAQSLLSFALGKDISGRTVVGDLAKMPHVLVAGATGSGKSVCINGIIASILFRAKPDEVKFIMIDPKMVELGIYNGIPHLFAPVVTEARRAAAALRKVIAEMEHRYELFSQAKVRDLERYNQFAEKQGKPRLPLIVVIIDELADLMMVAPGDVEDAICRLAQMARASGIHLVVATQRPSVDVITGLIKANIPSRIAFSVSSGVDSRTILDSTGAEKLLGRGDMLYMPVGASKPVRLQGAFLSEPEVERLVEFVRRQQEAQYLDDFSALTEDKTEAADDLDPLFEEAVRIVVESEQASVSFLQRKLKVGYARAARLVDSLEAMGIVGPFENSKPREVLMSREQWLTRHSSSG